MAREAHCGLDSTNPTSGLLPGPFARSPLPTRSGPVRGAPTLSGWWNRVSSALKPELVWTLSLLSALPLHLSHRPGGRGDPACRTSPHTARKLGAGSRAVQRRHSDTWLCPASSQLLRGAPLRMTPSRSVWALVTPALQTGWYINNRHLYFSRLHRLEAGVPDAGILARASSGTHTAAASYFHMAGSREGK